MHALNGSSGIGIEGNILGTSSSPDQDLGSAKQSIDRSIDQIGQQKGFGQRAEIVGQ
jgi:hypothetical protein